MKQFLSTNIHQFKGDILLVGSCVPELAKKYFDQLSKGRTVYQVCLQEHHQDSVVAKLSGMLALEDISSLTILTMDGSPHCVTLHFSAESAKKYTGFKGRIDHYVVEDDKLVRVSAENVRKARHLSMQ